MGKINPSASLSRLGPPYGSPSILLFPTSSASLQAPSSLGPPPWYSRRAGGLSMSWSPTVPPCVCPTRRGRGFIQGTVAFLLSRFSFSLSSASGLMGEKALLSHKRSQAILRHHKISSLSTELLELHSEKPLIHILLIPGNPGVVSFYKYFIEEIYENMEGNASVSAIGHVSHSKIDYENGRTFSLADQINHKVEFIKEEFRNTDVPIIMVGHSIGSYICLEIFRRLEKQVKFTIGLYPFLKLNRESFRQSMIGLTTRTRFLCIAVSSFIALLGLCPSWIKSALVKRSLGQSCSALAVDATCSHLLKYHTIRNILFMAETEFEKLSEEPDWVFMNRKQQHIALLFGSDDHWGPLSHYEEVSRRAPGISLSIEREGHSHAFCCTEAGSAWVARYVANIIKKFHPT